MSADVDKLVRAMLIQAYLTDDIEALRVQLGVIAGEENVALVMRQLEHMKNRK
jgi:hypothetical protein